MEVMSRPGSLAREEMVVDRTGQGAACLNCEDGEPRLIRIIWQMHAAQKPWP